VQRTFEDMANVTQRAAELTRALLAFSRKQHGSPRSVRLADVLRTVQPIVARLAGEAIAVSVEPPPDDVVVRVDQGQLELALLNLVSNARDAMPTGGALRLRGGAVELGEADPGRPAGLRAGAYATIELADTGTGMTADVMAHLFEPFFTTKPTGKGTGLGLATSHGTVRQAGGAITVDSRPGAGSTFRILLPLSGEPPTAEPAPPSALAGERGSERVLVVEDEPAVRRATVRVLEGLGYQVHAAGSAEEALAMPAELLGRIDLLVSDVVLGGMRGTELAERLRTAHGTPAVLMSGYLADDAREALAASGTRVLAKPFTPEVLGRSVRQALDAAPRRAP
jgi:two-component system, cell cycle sensor histidine kinase and response regulator CckA